MEKRALLITCLVLLICTKDMMARNLKTSYKKKVSLEPKHHVLVSTETPAYAFGMLNVAASAVWPGLSNNIYTANDHPFTLSIDVTAIAFLKVIECHGQSIVNINITYNNKY